MQLEPQRLIALVRVFEKRFNVFAKFRSVGTFGFKNR
jgi:hypothetical protein